MFDVNALNSLLIRIAMASELPSVSRPGWLGKAAATVKRELAGGTSPDRLALAVAVGCVCGLFPIYGATTAVAGIAGIAFRANQIVVQIFNYAMYPIYFFIEFALIAVGAWVFEGDLHAYSPDGLRALFDAGWTAMLTQGARAFGQAVAVWMVLAFPTGIALKSISLAVIRRWPSLAARPTQN